MSRYRTAQRVPFGNEGRWREATGLTEAEACTVIALIAAEAAGRLGGTASEVAGVTGLSLQGRMAMLERARWVHQVARIEGSTEKVWRATPRAWRELGFVGWTAELQRESA